MQEAKSSLGCRRRREEARYWGEIDDRPEAVRNLLRGLIPNGERLRACYWTGPCGYELYRLIVATGQIAQEGRSRCFQPSRESGSRRTAAISGEGIEGALSRLGEGLDQRA